MSAGSKVGAKKKKKWELVMGGYHGAEEGRNQEVTDIYFLKGSQINFAHREFVK